MDIGNKSSSHAVYSLRLHIVFVTKYRRRVLNDEIISDLRQSFAEILEAWRCSLIEFGAEEDHVHILASIQPALNISTLINNLKSASSKRIRGKHWNWLRLYYDKPVLWHRAYYVGSVGGASLETVRAYVDAQGSRPQNKTPSRASPA